MSPGRRRWRTIVFGHANFLDMPGGCPDLAWLKKTNNRMRSSPGGEETGESGQSFAPGAHILTRGRILSHTDAVKIASLHCYLVEQFRRAGESIRGHAEVVLDQNIAVPGISDPPNGKFLAQGKMPRVPRRDQQGIDERKIGAVN